MGQHERCTWSSKREKVNDTNGSPRLSTDPWSVPGMPLLIHGLGGGARGQAEVQVVKVEALTLAANEGKTEAIVCGLSCSYGTVPSSVLPCPLPFIWLPLLNHNEAREVQKRKQKLGGGSLVQDRLGGAIYGSCHERASLLPLFRCISCLSDHPGDRNEIEHQVQ